MPTSYPGGTDRFFEPSLPEQIPLSDRGYQPGSTNVLGRRPRNHVEHHRDLGDAVEALQENAAQVNHDHSGVGSDTTKGPKLKQANTHEQADTDQAAASLHHTLGTGANQAAAGNHTHGYPTGANYSTATITGAPIVRCTFSPNTRPANPTPGLIIYETDTNRMWVWADFGRGSGLRWNILPTANVPVLRLSQREAQTIPTAAGTFVKWSKVTTGDDPDEDTFEYFNPSTTDASKQQVTIGEPGVYQIDCAVQWGAGFLPELATVIVCRDGAETGLRYSRLQTPNILNLLNIVFNPDRSQTVQVSGKLRFTSGQKLSVKCRYGGAVPGGSFVNTFFDLDTKVRSRLDVHYVGP